MMKLLKIKNIIVVFSSIVFAVLILYTLKTEYTTCMGLSFITEEEVSQMTRTQIQLDNIICLEDTFVPYTSFNRKIFLPCDVTEETKFYDLEGRLTSILPEYDLYFLWEDAFQNLKEAVRYSCNFTLYAIDSAGNYATYSVILSTLPIIDMHGEVSYVDEREREIYAGRVTMWDPDYQDTDKLSVQESLLEWHVRGFSSSSLPLPPLKLNLKEKNGNQNKLSFLGLECDDDYLLNPMGFDDTFVREKLAMSLWNEMADAKNSSLKMTQGEYCELIVNGEYLGIRLVQNKIEKGYLKLGEEDTLFKGKNVNRGTKKPPEEVYEVIYSAQDEETTYQTISEFFYQSDFSNINLDSWVELQLFLQLGNMVDNEVYKNIYYVIERDQQSEGLSFIPWDTDMSFGVYWSDGFRLMPETVETITYRLEYEKLRKQYPEIDDMLAQRWKELRNNVYSDANILNKIDSYYGELYDSGAMHRDFNVLGWYAWGGDDTIETVKTYVVQRLKVLDQHYNLYLNE